MLYLIKDRDYIKIGFTKDLEDRIKTYKTHNVYFELIDTKPGTKRDETILHDLCKNYQYKSEWFYNDEKVIQIWNEYQSQIIGEYINILKECIDKRNTKIKQYLENYLIGESRLEIQRNNNEIAELNKILNYYKESNDSELKKYFKYYDNQTEFIYFNNKLNVCPTILFEKEKYEFVLDTDKIIKFSSEELLQQYKRKLQALSAEYTRLETDDERKQWIMHVCTNLYKAGKSVPEIWSDVSSCTLFHNCKEEYYDRPMKNVADIIRQIEIGKEALKTKVNLKGFKYF